MQKTDKELLSECRLYVANAHYIAENEYDNPDSDVYDDPRVLDAINRAALLLEAIDYALATRH